MRIGTDDLVEGWLIPQVVGIARDEAPGVVVRSIPTPTDRASDALEVGDLQLAIGRRPLGTRGIRHELLARVEIAMMIRQSEAPRTRRMPMQLYLERPHVVIHKYHSGPNVVDIALQGLGLQRKVGASVQSFYTMLATAADTGFLCAVPGPMAKRFAQAFGLSAHTLPFKVDPIPLYMIWHERYDADAAIRWMAGCVQRAIAQK
jgi:DNA-binding transcriptional LysR family regulator